MHAQGIALYIGGENNCAIASTTTRMAAFGFRQSVDRHQLAALECQTRMPSEVPIIAEGHAFHHWPPVPRTGIEHVFPNTRVEDGVRNGLRCDTNAYMNHHFTAGELTGSRCPISIGTHTLPAFGRRTGLVLISSCGHACIINTLRRAQDVTNQQKYALVGGCHLAPAPDATWGYGGTEEVQPRTCARPMQLQRSKLH